MESLWPLLVPPLMTLVDDYEPAFKLRGILAMADVLERVSASLLKRTGLDVLLLNVCNGRHSARCLRHMFEWFFSQTSPCQQR